MDAGPAAGYYNYHRTGKARGRGSTYGQPCNSPTRPRIGELGVILCVGLVIRDHGHS